MFTEANLVVGISFTEVDKVLGTNVYTVAKIVGQRVYLVGSRTMTYCSAENEFGIKLFSLKGYMTKDELVDCVNRLNDSADHSWTIYQKLTMCKQELLGTVAGLK